MSQLEAEWAAARTRFDAVVEQRDAVMAERDRYREALERIVDLGDYAARIAREALISEAGKR